MTDIEYRILEALNKHKEIHGTETLAEMIGSLANVRRVRAHVLILVKHGMIKMEPSTGGRGNKTIYRDAGVLQVQR